MKDVRFFNIDKNLISTSVKIGGFKGGGTKSTMGCSQNYGTLTRAKGVHPN